MSSKSKELLAQVNTSSSLVGQLRPRSLRLRLVLWYGILIAIALGCFVLFVLSFTTDTLQQSVNSAVRAEARAATIEVSSELTAAPPYWPQSLSLNTLNTYRDPGVVVEVIDNKGQIQYDSDKDSRTSIPSTPDVAQAIHAGQSYEYTDQFSNELVRIAAVPLRAPSASSSGYVTGAGDRTEKAERTGRATEPLGLSANSGPVIGTLLVAKSLHDVNATLALLRTLLLLVGAGILLGALLGGWAIAARALHPLTEMAQTARAIAATTVQGTRIGNLSSRVKRPRGNDEMAQMVDALNEMLANLEKAIQGQRRFVADASHELRAPLTTIQGNLAFLRQHAAELPAEERQTMLDDAHGETLRLAQLVEELLLLARADAQVDKSFVTSTRTKAEKKEPLIELDRVALQLVRQLRGRLSAEETAPRLEIGSIEPVRVRGDEESLRRVILILLDNALKYTLPSTEPGKGSVNVSVERTETEAVLQVSDTGIGIAPDELPHIFERFYRADRARSRQGTGLGLSIAQTLVEQLGGRITAESTSREGSTFRVWLPLA